MFPWSHLNPPTIILNASNNDFLHHNTYKYVDIGEFEMMFKRTV